MIRPQLVTALSVYDEAALVLLANKGLYRRALRDMKDGRIAIGAVDAESVLVNADGDTVRIDMRGPQFATCTCSAPGICRHRLAAVLVVQAASKGGETIADAGDLDAEIGAHSIEALRKWAGKAAWQAALELAETATATRQPGAINVSFPQDGIDVRILAGQGLDGIVSKVGASLRKTFHIAAMLAARRSAGIADTEEAGTQAQPVPVSAADPSFLAEVEAALGECARVAFNLAPLSLEEHLFRLSVSSRIDAMPRLSAMLRALSRQIRNRRNRDLSFDIDECLGLCASTFALVNGLRHNAPGGTAHLYGAVRQDYVSAGDLALAGCGSDSWTTLSGARGVTGHFYQADADRWLTLTLARAAGQDSTFDPTRAYRAEGLWGGHTFSSMSGSRILLTDALVSSDGRLSSGQASRASTVGKSIFPDALGWPCRFEDWALLHQRLSQRLTMAGDGRAVEPVIIAPHRLARPSFDDLTQVLSWPVEDCQGRWISLSLAYGRDRPGLLEGVEKMAASGWSGTIIALGSIEGNRFRLRPIAFADSRAICNLGLDDISAFIKPNLVRSASHLIRGVATYLGQRPSTFANQPPSATIALISHAWRAFTDIAEIGVDQNGGQVTATMGEIASRMADAGFHAISRTLAEFASADTKARPASFLKASYALVLARRHTLEMHWLSPI
jgi:hypothetical protein